MSSKPVAQAPQSSAPASSGCLIPERLLDVPTQRLYAISLAVVTQAIKIFDFVQYLFSFSGSTLHYGRKWLLVDMLLCLGIAQLRIPRLNYPRAVVFLQILGLWAMDGILFGGIELHLLGGHRSHDIAQERIEYQGSGSGIGGILSRPLALLGWDASPDRDSHLLGQHTVRMSPISTAFLNPYGQSFCFSGSSSHVLIPILLNNSNPTAVRYTLTPLGYTENSGMQILTKTVGARELKASEATETGSLQLSKIPASKHIEHDGGDDYDEYDEYDDEEQDADAPKTRLQTSQSLVYITIAQPGTVHLQDVKDASGVDARVVFPSSVTIAPCPHAEFRDDDVLILGDSVRCMAPDVGMSGDDITLGLEIYGVPPLSLKWYKEVNGKQEYFMVEGIENTRESQRSTPSAPQTVHVPLTVQARTLGTHVYALDSVTDALGNTENLRTANPSSAVKYGVTTFASTDEHTKSSRVLHVLRRPSFSFKSCNPTKPTKLKIDSEAHLLVGAINSDAYDEPWDISIRYSPPEDASGIITTRRLRAWQRTSQTNEGRHDLRIKADAPGLYTIDSVKGKYCEGDVLSPETCPVVEIPKPSADIKWKRIHECSGDTGVEASVLLLGTPPFHLYYRMQRDKEPPRELVKAFQTSRGEMTLQPPQSGHYVYTFTHISDSNYNKVELDGPKIDQIVHPLASASIVTRTDDHPINSCSGDEIEIDVELTGIGPWILDVQTVTPKESKTHSFTGIQKTRQTLSLAIPDRINEDGGSFDVVLVAIQDSSGCKRSLLTPGMTVNVRRDKPTARFYGKKDERRITTLDYEVAKIPLRLTGEGPWVVKYRNLERMTSIDAVRLNNPNGYLQVRGQGTYEIVEVHDSQCPGTVIAEGSTYELNWTSRPSAKLADGTSGVLEHWNGSFILPPICEGSNSYVDLDLTGRPPFQIMYNIARGESGGTKVIDQPVFNSIQARTRFQLHTSEPGHIFYEVKQIGDAAYPLTQHRGTVIPRSYRPLFEQEVLKRPSARFRTLDRLSYCLNDALVPFEKYSADGTIVLEGTPPFELTLSMKNLAAGIVHTEVVTVNERVWKLDLPKYKLQSVGQHIVSIESVQDAAHCEQTVPDPRDRSIFIDVAESAAIVPYDRRDYFCVGEVAQFQLEGIPPWTVNYRTNGKSHVQEASTSPFSIPLQQSGEFKVVSVAHQQQRCRSAVTDLTYNVHPLPSARVGQGKRVYQDIHEGDQAEIKFTLIGEPPFTFTYQRAEASSKKGGRPGKVLETHTVSGVTGNEYSIFSASEGTWTVTFISDRHCRYPPVHPEV